MPKNVTLKFNCGQNPPEPEKTTISNPVTGVNQVIVSEPVTQTTYVLKDKRKKGKGFFRNEV